MTYINKAIEKILNAGLSVAERDNLSLGKGTQGVANNHLTIIGGVRRVELYTNGTIYANRVNGKFKITNLKGMPHGQAVEEAIKIAKTGRY